MTHLPGGAYELPALSSGRAELSQSYGPSPSFYITRQGLGGRSNHTDLQLASRTMI